MRTPPWQIGLLLASSLCMMCVCPWHARRKDFMESRGYCNGGSGCQHSSTSKKKNYFIPNLSPLYLFIIISSSSNYVAQRDSSICFPYSILSLVGRHSITQETLSALANGDISFVFVLILHAVHIILFRGKVHKLYIF